MSEGVGNSEYKTTLGSTHYDLPMACVDHHYVTLDKLRSCVGPS